VLVHSPGVSVVPALLLAMPFTVLAAFTLNVLLVDFGAADAAGTGAGVAMAQLGPLVTVLVVAGSRRHAICADLGARTIREELDALRVMGIDPVQFVGRAPGAGRLPCGGPAVAMVSLATLVGSFIFSVFVQGVTPGYYVAGLTLLMGPRTSSSRAQGRPVRPGRRPHRLLQGHLGRRRPGRRRLTRSTKPWCTPSSRCT